jgi:hypothetical protein
MTSISWGAAGSAALLAGGFLNKGAAALWVFDQVLMVWQLIFLAAKPASKNHWSASSTRQRYGKLQFQQNARRSIEVNNSFNSYANIRYSADT